ncbi:MAG TPA: GNAT family N-acetyltransferase [Gemmatimonadales bacterium]|nr:GNAT family N-acetyltransferase [Gemmatimonadales bacterium]
MWRPERSLHGPERPTVRDIEPLNRVFSEAFTDRYGRDGMVGVRVPFLNPLVWRYAIEDAGEGAMIWRDGDGGIVAFNMVHHSGSEGWMGPLAVRPDRQGDGLGTGMVRTGLEWLKDQGCRTIGLETMPRTVENIGFYSRLGLTPGHLTITVVKDLPARRPGAVELLSTSGDVAGGIAECRALVARLSPGVDFTRELELTLELVVGDVSLVRRGSRLVGYALWHAAPLAAGRPRDELRVLKVVAEDHRTFVAVVEAVQAAAQAERVRRVALRCQTAFRDAYHHLIGQGFRVHWTDLRMTLRGHPEPALDEAVVMSNWEI